MNDLVIEKGIPVPPTNGPNALIISNLEVGDSFLTDKQLPAFMDAAKRRNFKLLQRKQADGKFRIWRIA